MGQWGKRWASLPSRRRRPAPPRKTSGILGLSLYFPGLPLVLEYRFAPPRRWRFDAALPQYMIGIEQEGGLWVRGRHNRAQGYIADMAKYNAAVLLGWRVLRFTPLQICDGTAAAMVQTAITGSRSSLMTS